MKNIQINNFGSMVSVAPMMKWTDRHCRYFHRQLSLNSFLYTEMIPVNAIIFGKNTKSLNFSKEEHPIAIQIGGSEFEVSSLCF